MRYFECSWPVYRKAASGFGDWRAGPKHPDRRTDLPCPGAVRAGPKIKLGQLVVITVDLHGHGWPCEVVRALGRLPTSRAGSCQAPEKRGKACAARSVGTLLDLAFDLAIHEHTFINAIFRRKVNWKSGRASVSCRSRGKRLSFVTLASLISVVSSFVTGGNEKAGTL